jgi:hypothetical protein
MDRHVTSIFYFGVASLGHLTHSLLDKMGSMSLDKMYLAFLQLHYHLHGVPHWCDAVEKVQITLRRRRTKTDPFRPNRNQDYQWWYGEEHESYVVLLSLSHE